MSRFRDLYNTIINLRGKEPNGPFTVALFSRLFLLDQQRLYVEMPSSIQLLLVAHETVAIVILTYHYGYTKGESSVFNEK